MNPIDILTAESLTRFLFNMAHIGCDPVIYWVPSHDNWEFNFRTTFKYLYFDITIMYDRWFMKNINFEVFQRAMIQIRDQVAKEYNYYFSALWC